MKKQKSKYGNIDGIATLTNNPNATDNAKGTIGKIMKSIKMKKVKYGP